MSGTNLAGLVSQYSCRCTSPEGNLVSFTARLISDTRSSGTLRRELRSPSRSIGFDPNRARTPFGKRETSPPLREPSNRGKYGPPNQFNQYGTEGIPLHLPAGVG